MLQNDDLCYRHLRNIYRRIYDYRAKILLRQYINKHWWMMLPAKVIPNSSSSSHYRFLFSHADDNSF